MNDSLRAGLELTHVKSVKDQPQKQTSLPGAVLPAQVDMASAAKADAPAETRKPGKYIGLFSDSDTTVCRPKAANLEDDPLGVEKGVLKCAIYGKLLVRVSDGMAARSAEDGFALLHVRLLATFDNRFWDASRR